MVRGNPTLDQIEKILRLGNYLFSLRMDHLALAAGFEKKSRGQRRKFREPIGRLQTSAGDGRFCRQAGSQLEIANDECSQIIQFFLAITCQPIESRDGRKIAS